MDFTGCDAFLNSDTESKVCSCFAVMVAAAAERAVPSKMTVMGFGLNPSPPGQRVLYSAINKWKTNSVHFYFMSGEKTLSVNTEMNH